METANNVQQASGKAVVLDTTGTGIPTVETHDTDAPGAKDGPITAADLKVGQVWCWKHYQGQHIEATITRLPTGRVEYTTQLRSGESCIREVDMFLAWLNDNSANLSPIAGRITPEADEQTDRKSRTLTQIDAALEDFFQWRDATDARLAKVEGYIADDARPEFDAIDKRSDAIAGRVEYVCGRLIDVESKLDRLIAAQVPKPCEPSKATGQNELATAVHAADWREALVVEAYPDPSATRWLCTPDRKWYWNVDEWFTTSSARDRDLVDDNDETANARRTCTEPPNLREWWPVKADDFKPTPEQQRFLASVCESCRAVVRAMLAKGDIPGVVKTNQS